MAIGRLVPDKDFVRVLSHPRSRETAFTGELLTRGFIAIGF